MVTMDFPAAAEIGVTQERRGAPSSKTVQEPHWPSPQPYLQPVKPRWSRRMVRRDVSGLDWIECRWPLTWSSMDSDMETPPQAAASPGSGIGGLAGRQKSERSSIPAHYLRSAPPAATGISSYRSAPDANPF